MNRVAPPDYDEELSDAFERFLARQHQWSQPGWGNVAEVVSSGAMAHLKWVILVAARNARVLGVEVHPHHHPLTSRWFDRCRDKRVVVHLGWPYHAPLVPDRLSAGSRDLGWRSDRHPRG